MFMSMPTARFPSQPAEHVSRELAEILAIYERLYPARHLNFYLYEGDNPVWSEPTVIEGEFVPGPEHLSPEYLGHLACPGKDDAAPPVTVMLSVPRAADPREASQTEPDWKPVRLLRMIYFLNPLIYEQIRHMAEMIRRWRRDRGRDMVALARGHGTPLMTGPGPQANGRPAILIGMHWLELGGAENLAFDCIGWALEAGLRVFVIAAVPSLQRLAERLPQDADIRFIRLDRYLPHHLWPRFVERLVQGENIRLVHIHHCAPLYRALPYLRARAPWVRVIDSTHIVEYADGGYPRISGTWSNFIDIHHVISDDLIRFYRDRFHAAGKLALGRMLDRSQLAQPLAPMSMRAGKKSLHFAFVGRFYYQKRPIVLIAMLRALMRWARRSGLELRATVMGEGPFRAAICRLLRRYGLTERVEIRSSGMPVSELLEDADILLLPSSNEGLALVCYEAVRHGCIPISTRVGAQDELLPEGLLLPLSPFATVRAAVRLVDRLWRDGDFLARQVAELNAAWTRLGDDPTAREVLMPIYLAAAGTGQERRRA